MSENQSSIYNHRHTGFKRRWPDFGKTNRVMLYRPLQSLDETDFWRAAVGRK